MGVPLSKAVPVPFRLGRVELLRIAFPRATQWVLLFRTRGLGVNQGALVI